MRSMIFDPDVAAHGCAVWFTAECRKHSLIHNTMTEIETVIIQDKELRRDIDGIIQRLKHVSDAKRERCTSDDHTRASRERSICVTKLQEAVMWLGMDLKAINEENPGAQENPYPDSKDPSNTKIAPTADGLKL